MRCRRCSGIVIVVMLAVAARPAAAVASPPDASLREHQGLYLRFDAGYGYMTFAGSHSLEDRVSAGPTELVALAAGGALHGLILYGAVELEALRAFSPGTYSTSLLSIGPGMAYFVDPLHLYFTVAIQYTEFMSLAQDDNLWGRGFHVETTAGERISISARWSLGLAGRLSATYLSLPGGRATPLDIGLVASAMYN